MRRRSVVACAVVLAAAAPAFAQDWFEPNPSLARLTADDAYARTSAESLRTAGIRVAGAIRLDDAGRVVVAGGHDGTPRIVRLDVDGRLDPTFGVAGVADLSVWGGDAQGGLEIDAAGRIVVTGSFGDSESFLWDSRYAGPVYGAARLLDDGSLDPAFSGDGLLELDEASGLSGLAAVHASGLDGAMLAVAEKAGLVHDTPVGDVVHDTLVGVVRMAADGTLDATYGGGGFAEIQKVPYWRDVVDPVADFAVDSIGRAVVAGFDYPGFGGSGPPRGVLRFDAAGTLDTSFLHTSDFFSPTTRPAFTASRIALDGAERIVDLDYPFLLRRLPDGVRDRTFAAGGSAWHLATGFDRPTLFNVNVRDAGELLQYFAVLAAQVSADPSFLSEPLGGRELLAVATRADRWALAKLVSYRDARGRVVAYGIGVQAIDPADPGAIVSTTYRFPEGSFGDVAGLVLTPDGTSAYALGGSFVLRVDLTMRKALPLPDLRVKWLGWPHAVDFGGGRYRVSQSVRVRNVSSRDASVVGEVAIGDGSFDGPLLPLVPLRRSAKSSRPFTLRGRSTIVRRFTWEGDYGPADLAGARLTVRLRSELPDANPADNTATSRTISPLYAPR
jgi:uncharacterized delta-60 repeat protein